jgi:hypothetical protein
MSEPLEDRYSATGHVIVPTWPWLEIPKSPLLRTLLSMEEVLPDGRLQAPCGIRYYVAYEPGSQWTGSERLDFDQWYARAQLYEQGQHTDGVGAAFRFREPGDEYCTLHPHARAEIMIPMLKQAACRHWERVRCAVCGWPTEFSSTEFSGERPCAISLHETCWRLAKGQKPRWAYGFPSMRSICFQFQPAVELGRLLKAQGIEF